MRRKILALGLLLMFLALPLAGAAYIPSETKRAQALAKISMYWYYAYMKYDVQFGKLYNESIAAGVDNQTLTLAHALYDNATLQFKKAVGGFGKYGFPLPYEMLRAYRYIREAVGVLKLALNTTEIKR
ncbi:hypothetical protein JCM16138_14730 [Thermococcus atlanticus]